MRNGNSILIFPSQLHNNIMKLFYHHQNKKIKWKIDKEKEKRTT